MATNSEARQIAIRTVTSTTGMVNEDWLALFTARSIPAGTFNERLSEVSETYNKNVLVKEILSFLKENLNRPLVHPKMGKH